MLVGLRAVVSMPFALHNCMLQPALAPLDTQEMHVEHVIQVSNAQYYLYLFMVVSFANLCTMWSLKTDGHYLEMVVCSGFTVRIITFSTFFTINL
jgi:hypothetical protein